MDWNFLDLDGVSHLWLKITSKISEMIAGKVDKVDGKGLSTNDFTNDLKTKLDGVSTGATKTETSTTNGNIKINGTEKTVYTHPAAHAATMITEDATHRFTTDTEKSAWNAKTTSDQVQTMIDDTLSTFTSVEYIKLEESQYNSDGKPTIEGKVGKIYLVPNGDASPNKYNEWIYLTADKDFELIDSKTLDLSGYAKISDIKAITNEQIDTITG